MEQKLPEVLAKRVAYESKKLRVIEQDLKFGDGHCETWEHVELKSKGGVKIIAMNEEKELIFVREYRGAAGRYVLRFPTGSIEEHETPGQAALRELEEETGCRPRNLQFIEEQGATGSYYKSQLYLFLATDLEKVDMKRDPAERDMKIIKIPYDKVEQMVYSLELENPQNIYAFLRLKKYLMQ